MTDPTVSADERERLEQWLADLGKQSDAQERDRIASALEAATERAKQSGRAVKLARETTLHIAALLRTPTPVTAGWREMVQEIVAAWHDPQITGEMWIPDFVGPAIKKAEAMLSAAPAPAASGGGELNAVEKWLDQEDDGAKWRIFNETVAYALKRQPFESGSRAAGFVADMADKLAALTPGSGGEKESPHDH